MRAIFCPGPSYHDPQVRQVAGWVRILDLYRDGLKELGYEVIIPKVDPALLDGTAGVSRVLAWGVAAAMLTRMEGVDLILCPSSYGLPVMMTHPEAAKVAYVWNNEDSYRHSMLEREYRAAGLPYDTAPTNTWLNHTGLNLADHVLSCSPFVKATHAQVVPPEKISISFWGVDSVKFTPPPGEPPGYRVLFVGGDPVRKGLKYLVEAFGRFILDEMRRGPYVMGRAVFPEPELWVVGCQVGVDSPYIKVLGMVPHSQMPEIYRQCHVQVQPSMEDGLSLCVQEGMASGVVPVATADPAEVFEDGVSGIRVPYRDVEAIRSAIEKLRDPAVRRPMAQAARALAERQSWGQTKKDVQEVVRRVVERHSAWDAWGNITSKIGPGMVSQVKQPDTPGDFGLPFESEMPWLC